MLNVFKIVKNIYYLILGSIEPFPIPTDLRLIGIAFKLLDLIKILFSSINFAIEGTNNV
jgi:hypothetical protein